MKEKKRGSRWMSLMLRHEPETFGLTLDNQGFCFVDDLVKALHESGAFPDITRQDIQAITKENDKQRFEMIGDYIRARYGHSINVTPHEKAEPPAYLLHGTYAEALPSIREKGIVRQRRQYVHLSETEEFALLAGQRRGEAVLLTIDTVFAENAGVSFFYAGNGVWLSTNIPPHCVVQFR